MMSNSIAKSQLSRYGLIVFLILTLFLCAIFFYIRNNKVNNLTAGIKQLAGINENYADLDSCITLLYKADNNCRLYAITGEKPYIVEFTNSINQVSTILGSIKVEILNANKNKTNLRSLVEQNKIRTGIYIRLRKLTDSLISRSDQTNTYGNLVSTKTGFSYKQLKTVVKIDTLDKTIIAKPVSEKKFFGRVADVFKKKKVQVVDTSQKLVRKEIRLDTALESKIFNEIQLKRMKAFVRNLYFSNQKLRKNELEIIKINSAIIQEIISLVKSYKTNEVSFSQTNRAEVKEGIDVIIKSVDKIYLLIIGLLLLLVIAILYNLFKIFKNEKDLINYSEKASQYALSKSRFLANMSHEIRTPLNSVIGFSEQLSESNLSNQQAEQVSAIRSSSVMLLDVVNDILDFSKYETGKVNFDSINFRPAAAINEVFNSISIQAARKNIAFNKKISFKNDIGFVGDSLRLKQVIMNLLSNAIKFTMEGSVTIKADVELVKKEALLTVQIIDTGIGIGEEDIKMIFDEFAQVYYSSTKIKQKGTGLGLAICKKIVEFQGGQIWVTSELGKGSVFAFQIPYRIGADKENLVESHAKLSVDHLAGKRILLADDNKMNILLAQTVIKKYKMITTAAYDGKQALALFEQEDYDIVLTDIQMPEMGGVELTRKIRQLDNETKRNIPVLGITANVLEEDRKKYIESGINDLVLKPFSEKELIDKIAQYLS